MNSLLEHLVERSVRTEPVPVEGGGRDAGVTGCPPAAAAQPMVRPRLPGRYERQSGTAPLGSTTPRFDLDAETGMTFPRERSPASSEQGMPGGAPATSEITPAAARATAPLARDAAPRPAAGDAPPARGDADGPAKAHAPGITSHDREPPASPRPTLETRSDRRPSHALWPQPADASRTARETRPWWADPDAASAGNGLKTPARVAVTRPEGGSQTVRAPGDAITHEGASRQSVRPVVRPRTRDPATDRAASTVLRPPASGPAPPGAGRTSQVRPGTDLAVTQVQVTIGRVEVRAVYSPPPAPAAPARTRPAPAMSLEDYLKQREGGS